MGSTFEFDVMRTHVEDQEKGWSSQYRSLLSSKLREEIQLSPAAPSMGGSSWAKSARRPSGRKKLDKSPKHDPSFVVSAIAQSKNETRHLRDQLTKMEKRALLAEERAKEAIIMERRARAALEARDKQMASMRMRLEKYSTRSQVLEMRNKELDAYVTKLERKLGSEKAKKGAFAAVSSTPVRRVEKESLLDALAELQEENARLHAALQEVEEALDIEAKRLGLADGGALLESLRTRRMLETADLELKRETTKREDVEVKLRNAEMRVQVAEDERNDRIKSEEALLERCETTDRDNQALLDYIQEMSQSAPSPSPSKRMSLSSHAQLKEIKATAGSTEKSKNKPKALEAVLRAPMFEGSPNGSVADSLRAIHDKVEHSPGSPARRALIVRREDAMSSPASRTSPRRLNTLSLSSTKGCGGSNDIMSDRLQRIAKLKERLGLKKSSSRMPTERTFSSFDDDSDE